MAAFKIFLTAIFGFLVMVVALTVFKSWGPDKDDLGSFGHGHALTMCQTALRQVSRDPEKADVPYVDNQGSSGQYLYMWNTATKVARMRNGLGLDVATTATCSVDAASQSITSLFVNGQQVR